MALSPLDDRYASYVSELLPIFSESGLVHARIQVEVEWLVFLSDKKIAPTLKKAEIQKIRNLYQKFENKDFEAVKKIEKITNHDVKAVEIYIRDALPQKSWSWIHFGCTSEDINNTAYAILLRKGVETLLKPLNDIFDDLAEKSKKWKSVAMLSRTHGQSATPTTMGKEIAVFLYRLNNLVLHLVQTPYPAKFSGATGNFAAHQVACPDQDWMTLSQEFVQERLELTWNPLTTQIENHDTQAQLLNLLGQISTVNTDMCRDIWGYISLGYFGQKIVSGEVGSSTMPHKVNPIDFENAEGNFKLSRGIARTLSDELPLSRWQRDLTDSTLQRNFGLVFGHFLLGLKSLIKGLGKLEINPEKIKDDLDKSPQVLTEAVQMVLRAHGHHDAYDQLKKFSRGKSLSQKEIHTFINQTDLPEKDKKRLLRLTPQTYTGLSEKLVDEFIH